MVKLKMEGTQLNSYEGIFIIKPNLNEETSKGVLDSIEDEIKKGQGTVEAVNSWGKKRMAYRIKKFGEGLYYQLDFGVSPEALKDMDRKFRLNDNIIRFTIIRKEA